MKKTSSYTNYINKKNGLSSIQLYLKGIHCLGCISKIEASLKNLTAIKNLAINLSHKKANIEWESKKLTLEPLFQQLKKKATKQSLTVVLN